MTAWVVWQNTDFCTNIWEERLYNAVVGVIYCFCFFNLKEGRSRYRMAIFYTVTFVENLTFVAAYYWSAHHTTALPVTVFSLGAMVVVVAGTGAGLASCLLYYRFHHPAGPIHPCGGRGADTADSDNNKTGPAARGGGGGAADNGAGNDYVIKDTTYLEEKETVPELLVTMKPKPNLKPSRSFKQTIRKPPAPAPPPSPPRGRLATPMSSPLAVDSLELGTSTPSHASSPHSPVSSPHLDADCKTSEKMDSAYGTDSNRTASRNTETSGTVFVAQGGSLSPSGQQNVSSASFTPPGDLSGSNKSSSSAAFNNETYMSIENSPGAGAEDQSYMSLSSGHATPHSNNNTYQSVHPMSESGKSEHNTSQDSQASKVTVIDQSVQTPKRPKKDLLKRSPVVKDVTPEVPAQASSTPSSQTEKGRERLHAPLTIIIPNISHQAFTKPSTSAQSPDKWSDKTISLDILAPSHGPPGPDISNLTSHDYENLALVNINRAPLGPLHWRTYSDMANSRHDDSTKYEKSKLNFTSSSEYRCDNNAECELFLLSIILSRCYSDGLIINLFCVAAPTATSPSVISTRCPAP